MSAYELTPEERKRLIKEQQQRLENMTIDEMRLAELIIDFYLEWEDRGLFHAKDDPSAQ